MQLYIFAKLFKSMPFFTAKKHRFANDNKNLLFVFISLWRESFYFRFANFYIFNLSIIPMLPCMETPLAFFLSPFPPLLLTFLFHCYAVFSPRHTYIFCISLLIGNFSSLSIITICPIYIVTYYIKWVTTSWHTVE